MHIDTYKKGSELAEAGQEYDLYLLDVLMLGLTDIGIVVRLGRGNHAVVFITSFLEAVVDGYSVSTAGFVLRPVEGNYLETITERVANQYLGEREACISVIHNRISVYLRLERVAQFKNHLHRMFITPTSGETLAVRQRLSELQERLKEHPQFLRYHQGYAVNLEQVRRLEDLCFHTREGRLIPTSGNFCKQGKNVYYHHRLK